MAETQIKPEIATTADALAALRAAVERHGPDGSGLEHLRMPLRQWCTSARREAMSPEQMLVCVKHALDGVAAFNGDSTIMLDTMRTRIITFAINAYYCDEP